MKTRGSVRRRRAAASSTGCGTSCASSATTGTWRSRSGGSAALDELARRRPTSSCPTCACRAWTAPRCSSRCETVYPGVGAHRAVGPRRARGRRARASGRAPVPEQALRRRVAHAPSSTAPRACTRTWATRVLRGMIGRPRPPAVGAARRTWSSREAAARPSSTPRRHHARSSSATRRSCAKVLQLVNSAYFGLRRELIGRFVRRSSTSGADVLKGLALGGQSSARHGSSRSRASRSRRLQQHSLHTADWRTRLVDERARRVDDVFTAAHRARRRPDRPRAAGQRERFAEVLRGGARAERRALPRGRAGDVRRQPCRASAPICSACGACPFRSSRRRPITIRRGSSPAGERRLLAAVHLADALVSAVDPDAGRAASGASPRRRVSRRAAASPPIWCRVARWAAAKK